MKNDIDISMIYQIWQLHINTENKTMKRTILTIALLFACLQCFSQAREVNEPNAFFEGDWWVTRQECIGCPTTDTLRMEYAIVMFFPDTYEFAIALPTDGCDGIYETLWFIGLTGGYTDGSFVCYADGAELSITDDRVFTVRLSYLTQTGCITYSASFDIEDDVD